MAFNKVLIGCFLAYISYEIYGLYKYCQPPLETGGIVWDLVDAESVDISIYLSLVTDPPSPGKSSKHVLVGRFEGVRPSEAASQPDLKVDLALPKAFYKNNTVYLHAFAQKGGAEGPVLRHEWLKVSRYVLQKDRKVPTRYLLHDDDKPQAPGKPVSSLPRVIEVGFVQELRALSLSGLQEKGFANFVRGGKILLPLYVNTFISPRDEYNPLLRFNPGLAPAEREEATAALGMELRLRSVGLAYWTLQHQISVSFDEAEKSFGLNEYDIDSFKQMVGGSTPLKIVLVYGITICNLVFSYLAFTSDINFWRQKTSFEGLSSSSVALQAVMNIIMFLYVREQQQTKLIMYFVAVRFGLNLWKLFLLTTLRVHGNFPFLVWENRPGASNSLEELQDISGSERKCMFWLMIVLTPLIVAFSIYRLLTQRFRSWYSWAILTLAICSQMGGFVVMTPQVFMNYRLKSVEHLPWKALTYQAINTFIDDVFALCIRMPEIQKYSVFRDDIIFAICMLQRWLYRKNKEETQQEKLQGEKVQGLKEE